MSELDIIRAWKDKTYRNSLSADELAQLPEHPAGMIELTDDELANIGGESAPATTTTTATLSTPSIITAVSLTITLISYLSYRAGTNGSAASCCPCKTP